MPVSRLNTLRTLTLALAAIALQGCLAKAAVGIVTLPFRAISAGVDAATTSQSEADEKRGRAIRQNEERIGKLDRDYDKQMQRCADGDDEACEKAQSIRAEQKALISGEPER